MANWFDPILQGLQDFVFKPGAPLGQPTALNVNNLAGTGLIAGSTLTGGEPGSVTEARQFLRNQFTSPTGLTDQFTGQLEGLSKSFTPLLHQQEKRVLDEIQAREIAGQPQALSAQMSGPEIAALRQANVDAIQPTEQAFLGGLAQDLMTRQSRSAEDLLNENSQSELARSLGQLGALMLMRGQGGTTVNVGGTPGGTPGSAQGGLTGQPPGSSIFGGSGGGLTGTPALVDFATRAIQMANQTGNTTALEQLLVSGRLTGMPFPVGVDASTPAGQIIQQGINRGLVESPAAQGLTSAIPGAAGTAGGVAGAGTEAAGGGLASALGMAAGVAGTALAGGGVGDLIGTQIAKAGGNQFEAGVAGAAGGAAAGAATGALIGMVADGPGAVIGAIIGGIAGGAGGVFGASKQNRQQKNANIQQEITSTNAQRPEVLASLPAFGQAGQQLSNAVAPWWANNDPQWEAFRAKLAAHPNIGSLLQQAQQQFQPFIEENLGANADLSGSRQGVINLLHLLNAVGNRASEYLTPSTNPESNYGLLQSTETGKFGPGVKILQARQHDLQVAQQMMQQLVSMAGGA